MTGPEHRRARQCVDPGIDEWERVFVGLGSNVDQPLEQLNRAIDRFDAAHDITLRACSSFYSNPPMGPQDQPDFINAVVELRTELEPAQLLARLKEMEWQAGRRSGGERWGPRPLDLDLLLYGGRTLDTPALLLPHPGLRLRPFVLHPLAEIAPDAQVPGHGDVRTLAQGSSPHQLIRLAQVRQCSPAAV